MSGEMEAKYGEQQKPISLLARHASIITWYADIQMGKFLKKAFL